MRKLYFSVRLIFLFLIILACGAPKTYYLPVKNIDDLTHVTMAGVRSSSYGIKPFPKPGEWKEAINYINNSYPSSTPCGIWIIGLLHDDRTSCRLEFPSDGNDHDDIQFLEYDKHETYLKYFDEIGIKVFLQVEPANADIGELIDLVFNRYKHHECVIGFGVDVEWYKQSDKPGWGIPVSDESAKLWEKRVKHHNPDYQLFLKHWDRNWMPPSYRSEILFVSDSQIFKSFDDMLEEYIEYWAQYFYPNPVGYQIGYHSDKKWWQKFANPPEMMGKTIAHHVKQECGIFWVDFTLRDVIPQSKER